MKKGISILILTVLVLAFSACSKEDKSEPADNALQPQAESVDRGEENLSQKSSTEEGNIEVHTLTQEQQKLVGVWESPEGCIMAVRASRVPDWETGFPLDAIYLYPYISAEAEELDNEGWLKFTTEYDGCSIEVTDEKVIVKNETMCPMSTDPTRDTWCEYRMELDLATDELLLHYHKDEQIEGQQIMYEFSMTRTERDIEEGNWDWYYTLHPNRDIRK